MCSRCGCGFRCVGGPQKKFRALTRPEHPPTDIPRNATVTHPSTSPCSFVPLPNPPPITFTTDTVETISPPTINSSFSLTCSVTEGRFDWTWTRLTGDPLPPARVLNAGRTSVLVLSQLKSNDADTYRCLATHTFGGAFGTPVSNRVNITLSLEGNYDRRSWL